MKIIGMLRIIILSLLLFTTVPINAQSRGTKLINRIEFKADAKTTVVEGTVSAPVTVGPDMTDDGVERYTLRARAGQYFSMEISSDNQKALFTLGKPSLGQTEIEFVKNAAGVKRWSGRLSTSGDYLVTVFTREREAHTRFKLRVTTR